MNNQTPNTTKKTLSSQRTIVLLTLVAILSSCLGLWVALHLTPPQTKAAQHPKHPLADVSFKNLQNQPINLAKFKGQTIILNFWATWCPPCIKEMPELNTLYPELQLRNIELLGIGIDSPSNILKFSAGHAIDYPLLIAGVGGAELASSLGNAGGGLPFTVILDKTGSVMFKKLGQISADEIRAALK
jgi:peroxiredoxin